MIWVAVAVAVISAFLRFACRWRVKRQVSMDDSLVYFALLNLLCMAVLYVLVTPTMFTLDAIAIGKESPPADLAERTAFYLKCQFAIIVMFWTTLWAVKISVLLFYKNLFNKLPKQMTLWWAVLGAVVALYLGCWGSQLASCEPIDSYFRLGSSALPLQSVRVPDSIQEAAIPPAISELPMPVFTLVQLLTWPAIL